jgi:acetate kinase
MRTMQFILVLNGGSSSLKFALFRGDSLAPRLSGKLDRIDSQQMGAEVTDYETKNTYAMKQELVPFHPPIDLLLEVIGKVISFDQIMAVGHRLVHGGKRYFAPVRLTSEVLANLDSFSAYDPQHLPAELEMIRTFAKTYPTLLQIGCFDTAFHQAMPRVARLLPLPRRYWEHGIQRYGFHGLSYAYIMSELQQFDNNAANGRLILLHLGSGASMTAVHHGKSVDTTMAFTPTAGLVMGTRTGDLDPGLFAYLTQTEKMSPERFTKLINTESGLLGVSGISSDMRDLLACEITEPHAAEAIALFCYTVKKTVGAYAASLGGLDGLVFTGGIGENAAAIRQRICTGLEFLGIELDLARNSIHEPLISTDQSRVFVRVIKTDEELQIARSVKEILDEPVAKYG